MEKQNNKVKKVNIAIMGIGTVGGGTYDILTQNHDMILKTQGLDIKVVKVLDKSPEWIAKRTGNKELAAASLDEILADKSISIVVETMGGVEPAKTFIKRSLLAGKSVVSANKELISKHWPELESAAREGGAGFYFEASCVGGVPIIRTLTQSLQGDNIQQIVGIINGTTNYILTKMAEDNMPYEKALQGAQAAGFAEADPTADVEGYDAMYKLSILSSLAFHASIPYTSIYREGISKISINDIRSGAELGYTLKLLGIGRRTGDAVEVRVHPTFIPKNHPLSSVRNEFNAVFIKGDAVDNIMLYGRGAGARPTGSAIVSDIVFCAKQSEHVYSDFENNGKINAPVVIVNDFNSKYYFSLTVADKPGVLAKIADILGKHGVSINTLFQRAAENDNAPIAILTHETTEHSIQDSLSLIGKLAEVKSVDSLIRVL